MQENAPQAAAVAVRTAPAADVTMDEDDDPELAAALAMSMAEPQPGTSAAVCYLPACMQRYVELSAHLLTCCHLLTDLCP